MTLAEFEKAWMQYIENGRYKRSADPRLIHRAGSRVVVLFQYWEDEEWGISEWDLSNGFQFIGGTCCRHEEAMSQYMGEVARLG